MVFICCKPELTEEEKRRLLIQEIRKNIEKGKYEKLQRLIPQIDDLYNHIRPYQVNSPSLFGL